MSKAMTLKNFRSVTSRDTATRNEIKEALKQREELLAMLKLLADKVDETSECDHKRLSCKDIGCIGVEVKAARDLIANCTS